MRHRRLTFSSALAIAIAAVALVSVAVAGQTSKPTAKPTTTAGRKAPPRTAWGAPNLQGTWSSATITPLERPVGVDREFLTEAEVAQLERKAVEDATDEARGKTAEEDAARAYNDFWFDRGTKIIGNRRSSLIVDPLDGRIPALTPEARKRVESPEGRTFTDKRAALALGSLIAAGPEEADLWDRCLTRGLPILPGPYNNNYQIFQARDYVVILHEMIHESRIIPLDNRPHLPAGIRQWFGDARGRWEGDTLVVDTINISPKQELPFAPRTSAGGLHLVERFTRLDDDTLNYEFTIDDPTTYSKHWTAALQMGKSDGLLYEYACHEGNLGLIGILSGSRAREKAAEDAAKKGSR